MLANNSHADAGLAGLDPAYELAGVIRNDRLITDGLADYLRPKRDLQLSRELLERTGRGVAYTRTAAAYLFRRHVWSGTAQ